MITLKLIIFTSSIFVVNGKPSLSLPVIDQTNVISSDSSVGVAHVPAEVGMALSKTVHYAETPLVTGYTSTIYKPDLRAFDTPLKVNFPVFRPVKTLIPKVAVEPQIPVEFPILTADKEINLRTHILPEIPDINTFPFYYTPLVAPFVQ